MSPKTEASVDTELVRECIAGDATAWSRLIRRYRRLIYSIPVAHGMSAADASEVFQRVSVLLFENLGKLRRVESLTAWIVTTSRRECRAYLRAARRVEPLGDAVPEIPVAPPDVPERLEAVQNEHTLALAFAELKEPCHSLLTALYLEDPPPAYDELSRRLDRPIGSLGPTRSRCLEKLKKLYIAAGGAAP